MTKRGSFTLPFSAIVGQDRLKSGLLLNVVNPRIGGLLIRGAKGTGKSTAVYALADILPPVAVVADCPFGCSFQDPGNRCDSCRARFEKGEEIPTKELRMEVINLPLSITEDRLIGSIDVERILKEGEKALQPGLLAQANQNILYVDEINLLPDHITDDLLDVTAMGWNTVEREGFSITHPSRFVFVGSMNPEEGELRPQILDRFPLSTLIKTVRDEEARVQIIKNNLLFEKDPLGFKNQFRERAEKLQKQILNAQSLLPQVEIGEPVYYIAASTCAKLEVDGQRPDIVIAKTACAVAALDNRTEIREEDLLKSAFLALSHRTRQGGFEPPATEEQIQTAFQESCGKWGYLWKERGGAEVSALKGEGVAEPADETRVKKKS
ncbi:MAG: AAA domain-containing protein [candidate division Zixibacteria bacterium]|nr:AAA domain-containing protein [candidate division Zixibacteria bacterium]